MGRAALARSCLRFRGVSYGGRNDSTGADYSKTTDSENHFFYVMAAADRAEGSQVESELGGRVNFETISRRRPCVPQQHRHYKGRAFYSYL